MQFEKFSIRKLFFEWKIVTILVILICDDGKVLIDPSMFLDSFLVLYLVLVVYE